jgi:hypothetical protein
MFMIQQEQKNTIIMNRAVNTMPVKISLKQVHDNGLALCGWED